MIWKKKVELATRYGQPSYTTVHVADDHTIYVDVTPGGGETITLLGTLNQWGDLQHALEEAKQKSERWDN